MVPRALGGVNTWGGKTSWLPVACPAQDGEEMESPKPLPSPGGGTATPSDTQGTGDVRLV